MPGVLKVKVGGQWVPAGVSYPTNTAAAFAANYGGGVLTGNATTLLYVGTASIAQGFTALTPGPHIRCDVAGRYLVTGNFTFTGTAGTYVICRVEQWRSGVAIVGRDVVVANATNWRGASPAHLLDLQVGDTVSWSLVPDTATTLDARSWVSISSVGGAKGDKGDPGTGEGGTWNSAWGRLAFASTNTQQAGITSVVDLAGLSITLTPPAGRVLLITLNVVMQCDIAGARMDAFITDAANASFQLRSVTCSTASGDETMIVQAYATTAGAAMTFKGRAQRGSASGTMVMTGSRGSFISVVDVGPIAGATIVDPTRTPNTQVGTTYAPLLADQNNMVTLSNAAAITVTLPSNATQAFPVGAEVDFLWYGVGQPTFVAGSGATANGTPGLKLRARYSAATAKKLATNEWVVIGDLSA